MKISACWIAKNEHKTLGRSIESLKELADELIVVDTGSTDGTQEIARELGAIVHDFEWINDFSAARNFAMEQATGDVMFFLDADEWFDPKLTQEHIPEVAKFIRNKELDAMIITMYHVNDAGNVFSSVDSPRMFRNDPNLRYVNAVHESIRKIDGTNLRWHKSDKLTLKHSGYAESICMSKLKRNAELLELEKYPENDVRETARKFYLMRENTKQGNHSEAFKYFDMFLKNRRYIKDLLSYQYLVREFCDLFNQVAINVRTQVSRREIYRICIKEMQKLNFEYPGKDVSLLTYMLTFDYKEDKYLVALADYEKRFKVFKTDTEVSTEYKRHHTTVFAKGAVAQWRRGNKEMAADYAVKSFKSGVPWSFAPEALTVMLRCVDGVGDVDIIHLLTHAVNTYDKKVMEELLENLMYEKYINVYKYFFKKQIDAGTASKDRFLYLMTLTGKYEEAIQAAIDNRNDIQNSVFSANIFRAVICSGDIDLYLANKQYLARYERVLNAYFGGYTLDDPGADKIIALLEFRHIVFATGIETGYKFLSIYKNSPALIAKVKLDYYMDGGLYNQFLNNESAEIDVLKGDNYASRIVLAECFIGAKRYQEALEILEALLKEETINDRVLNNVLLIAEIAEGELKENARKIYNKYIKILDDIIDLNDVIHTKIVFDDTNKKEVRALAKIQLKDFKRQLSRTPSYNVELLKNRLKQAGRIYEEKKLFGMAEMCYRRLLSADSSQAPELYQCLARVYKSLGNAPLAAELEKLSKSAEKSKINMAD